MHGVVSQKTELFATTVVRTANPTLHALVYSMSIAGDTE
jgi:hypothetical protein